jgi:hypothetical protein
MKINTSAKNFILHANVKSNGFLFFFLAYSEYFLDTKTVPEYQIKFIWLR